MSRVKEVSLREILEMRKRELLIAQTSRCIECPSFVKHVGRLSEMTLT